MDSYCETVSEMSLTSSGKIGVVLDKSFLQYSCYFTKTDPTFRSFRKALLPFPATKKFSLHCLRAHVTFVVVSGLPSIWDSFFSRLSTHISASAHYLRYRLPHVLVSIFFASVFHFLY